mmetsp:Transcript_56137/g.109903  ORF Transcript_56137/g.109903 Transcript_56137/m.109903 type:complete len:337 (+) Transcript_56137:139-1149(+)
MGTFGVFFFLFSLLPCLSSSQANPPETCDAAIGDACMERQQRRQEKDRDGDDIPTPVPISANQVYKNPRPVELKGVDSNPYKGKISDAEWKARVELAAIGRLLYVYGFGSDLAAQCIMSRAPDGDGILMNEWGFFFEETTASSIVKVDWEDNLVDLETGERSPARADVVNMGCVPVATSILKARPDVNVVLHIHPIDVMAVASLEEDLQPYSQAAMMFHGQLSRYKYDFAYGDSFEAHLAEGFANGKRAMLLDHHGMYTVGRTVAEAFFVVFYITQAATVHLRAAATGRPLRRVSDEDLAEQWVDMMSSEDYAYDGSREWAGMVRKLNRELPGYEA